MAFGNSSQLSILILSEDSSSQSFPALSAIIKSALQLLFESCCQLKFQQCSNEIQSAVSGQLWREKSPPYKRDHAQVSLVRMIGSQVAIGSLVVFHADGDCAWEKRKGSTLTKLFKERILARVRMFLMTPQRPVSENKLTPEQADAVLKNLLLAVPYYSIEAWLFQNSTQARTIVKKKGPSAGDLKTIADWESNPGSLDEVIKPKDQLTIGSNCNQELAETQFPTKKVYDIGKSFHAFVEDLKSKDCVVEACSPRKMQ